MKVTLTEVGLQQMTVAMRQGCGNGTQGPLPRQHEPSRKAGYETDADESELSEWESGNVRQGPGSQISGKQISVATTPPVGGDIN